MPGLWSKIFGEAASQPEQPTALTAGDVKQMFQEANRIVQELEKKGETSELRQRISAHFSDKLQQYSFEELDMLLRAVPDASALIGALNKVHGLRNIDTGVIGTMAEAFITTLMAVRMEKNRS